MVKVLFVCMGNICRSPTAHGIFRDLVKQAGLTEEIHIDSAGTHAYHEGSTPDRRALETARRRGIAFDDLRARPVVDSDYAEFDYVIAMDQENFISLSSACPDEHYHKVHLMMDFAPELRTREVPDPYYGGASGFDRVYDLLEVATKGLFERIRHEL